MSKSLQERFYDECSKIIKCDYPCDSCYGCENKIKIVKGWLEDNKRPELHMNFPSDNTHAINGFIFDLIRWELSRPVKVKADAVNRQ
jgi:hypothetical protein